MPRFTYRRSNLSGKAETRDGDTETIWVLTGSLASKRFKSERIYNERKESLVKYKYLEEEQYVYRFKSDVPFGCPRAAASVITGYKDSGAALFNVVIEPVPVAKPTPIPKPPPPPPPAPDPIATAPTATASRSRAAKPKKEKPEEPLYPFDGRKAWEGYLREMRVQVRHRDPAFAKACKDNYNNQCQACGFSLILCGKPILECHHFDPMWTWDEERESTLEDVTALCPTCHRIAHAHKILPDPKTIRKLLEDNRCHTYPLKKPKPK